jgi:Tol biopolymer transport system component
MSLSPGTRLGSYEILGPLGKGGMGEVYRARDTKLNRDVAIKILPELFALERDRITRFGREAQLLAALNHSHIAQIYGVEDTRDGHALVMELVPGQPLSELIPAGGLPIAEALDFARQIGEGLEAAHEKGIIHRDLKPGNVMVTPDGQVKVLDFGLGKSLEPDSVSSLANSPTITVAATQAGLLLGTAAYMAPEQAKGRTADKRCDVWAFGAVLYEMLTGRRAFEGEDVTDTLAAILRGEPDWTALPSGVPPHVRRVLEQCLEKDRKRRLHDIGDVLLALDRPDVAVAAAVPAPAPARVRWRVHAFWLIALVVVGAGVGAAVWRLRTPVMPTETRLDITMPQTTDFTFAISPDARHLVFVAAGKGQSMLWLRPLDTTAARPLQGTEGATNPFWSPDSASIGFFSSGKIKRLALAGGAPQTITDASTNPGAAWGPDNSILFWRTAATGLLRIPASGGDAVPVTKLPAGALTDVQPQFLPDGKHFIFFRTGQENVRGVYFAALGDANVTRLTDADAAGRYIPPGWLAYVREGSLVARRFDIEQGVLRGEQVPLAESVQSEAGNSRRAAFSVSATGVVAYRGNHPLRRQLTWFDRKGAVLGTLGPVDDTLDAPDLSPDGKRAAVHRIVQRQVDVWVIDALRTTRFTFGPAGHTNWFALWSPDGSRVGYMKTKPGEAVEMIKPSTGAGDETLLAKAPSTFFIGMSDWSRDGRFILVDKSPVDIWVIPTEAGKQPFPFIDGTQYQERNARFSPDGRWVVFQSNESGRAEIYIRPFSESGATASGAGQWQVSTAGGAQPRWSRDGREVYWIAPDARLMAAPITVSGNSVEPGTPVVLFQTRIFLGGVEEPHRGQYAIAPDGRFLINTLLDEAASPPITVVHNWQPK